jgi:thioredoxin reductase (NADPH)
MYDVVIVGGGPAGLTACIFARTRRLNTLIIDAAKAGGQLLSIYPTKLIYDYPSYGEIEASELAGKLIEHARQNECDIRENETVTDIEPRNEHLEVITDKGSYESKAVILAGGAGLFEPRKLGIPGEEEFGDRGVMYKWPEKSFVAGKKCVIVGGGDSALENALSLVGHAGEIVLVHRRDKFRALESNVEEVTNSPIKVMLDSECTEIFGDDKVRGVNIRNNKKNDVSEMEADLVIINIGFSPVVKIVKKLGIELAGNQIKVTADMRTSKKGIFACGDIVTYESKNKRIITAEGEAATAVHSAYKYIKKPYWA